MTDLDRCRGAGGLKSCGTSRSKLTTDCDRGRAGFLPAVVDFADFFGANFASFQPEPDLDFFVEPDVGVFLAVVSADAAPFEDESERVRLSV